MKVIALGMGMQSTALYLMSSMRQFERADVAIFSDPMSEHPDTYKLVDWLLGWEKENDGIPIHIVGKDLGDALLNPIKTKTGVDFYPSLPTFFKNLDGQDALANRHCTAQYKIKPVEKKVRELMGLKPKQRVKPYEVWLGITIDEAQRMKPNRHSKITNRFPFIELMMNRGDCMHFMRDNGFPIPVKSSCVFCPYKGDAEWKDIKINHPKIWEKCVAIDESLRKRKGSWHNTAKHFLHKTKTPLKDACLSEDQIDMFGNECEGHCGL